MLISLKLGGRSTIVAYLLSIFHGSGGFPSENGGCLLLLFQSGPLHQDAALLERNFVLPSMVEPALQRHRMVPGRLSSANIRSRGQCPVEAFLLLAPTALLSDFDRVSLIFVFHVRRMPPSRDSDVDESLSLYSPPPSPSLSSRFFMPSPAFHVIVLGSAHP